MSTAPHPYTKGRLEHNKPRVTASTALQQRPSSSAPLTLAERVAKEATRCLYLSSTPEFSPADQQSTHNEHLQWNLHSTNFSLSDNHRSGRRGFPIRIVFQSTLAGFHDCRRGNGCSSTKESRRETLPRDTYRTDWGIHCIFMT